MSTAARPTASERPHPWSLGRAAPQRLGEYKWVYLWGLPLRVMHWTAAIAIVALIVSGFFIGRPYFVRDFGETWTLTMSRARFVHFLAAAVLVSTALVRLYWLVAGNKFERFEALFPVRGRDIVNFFKMVKFYLFLSKEEPHYLGHHPLQQLSYTGIYLIAVIEVLTGFALYAMADPTGPLGWALVLGSKFAGIQGIRWIHHVITWVFIIFIPAHIYLAARADVWEHGGTVSSIVSGGRFVPKDMHFVDE